MMNRTFKKRHFFLALMACCLPALSMAGSASAQQTTAKSWLDRPLRNWNRPSPAELPRLPAPVAATNLSQCRESIRKPESDAENALTRRGWHLIGPVQTFGTTQLLMATSGFDGMCRPLGYQAFVYVEGRYAGTLSPVLMNSRTDGALITARLDRATSIQVEFNRYRPADALCCPTQTSAVQYRVRADEAPDLIPISISTRLNCQMKEQPNAGSSSVTTTLFSKRWMLKRLGQQDLSGSTAYIEFDAKEQRVSGDSGCNRFGGSFKRSEAALTFSPLFSTKKACLNNEQQRIETGFLQALESITRFQIQTNTLRLYAGDRLVLVFKTADS
jgi:heat shock protein HslJ